MPARQENSLTRAQGFQGLLLWSLFSLFLLSNCQSPEAVEVVSTTPLPSPTLHPIFYHEVEPTTEANDEPTATPSPARAEPSDQAVKLISVYDETLNPNWSLENSEGIDFDLLDDTNPHSGSHVLAVQPEVDFAQLYFTVQVEAESSYPRDSVLGVRFWLYSGSDYIATSDLGVAVTGSRRYPYWVADDDSVPPLAPGEPPFYETRLYYLDVNRDIPPDTWVEIKVYLQRLQLDPDYDYVTGFYIKSDENFRQTYYIDQVQLITVAEEE